MLPLGARGTSPVCRSPELPGKVPLGSVARVVLGNQPLIGDALTRRRRGPGARVQKLPAASVAG